jgi:hypothetical protein
MQSNSYSRNELIPRREPKRVIVCVFMFLCVADGSLLVHYTNPYRSAIRVDLTADLTDLTPAVTTTISQLVTTEKTGTGDDGVISTAGCGTTKGCMHYPVGCQSPGDCVSVLTWRTTEPGFVDFEMMAPTDGWVAVALSFNRGMVSWTLLSS